MQAKVFKMLGLEAPFGGFPLMEEEHQMACDTIQGYLMAGKKLGGKWLLEGQLDLEERYIPAELKAEWYQIWRAERTGSTAGEPDPLALVPSHGDPSGIAGNRLKRKSPDDPTPLEREVAYEASRRRISHTSELESMIALFGNEAESVVPTLKGIWNVGDEARSIASLFHFRDNGHAASLLPVPHSRIRHLALSVELYHAASQYRKRNPLPDDILSLPSEDPTPPIDHMTSPPTAPSASSTHPAPTPARDTAPAIKDHTAFMSYLSTLSAAVADSAIASWLKMRGAESDGKLRRITDLEDQVREWKGYAQSQKESAEKLKGVVSWHARQTEEMANWVNRTVEQTAREAEDSEHYMYQRVCHMEALRNNEKVTSAALLRSRQKVTEVEAEREMFRTRAEAAETERDALLVRAEKAEAAVQELTTARESRAQEGREAKQSLREARRELLRGGRSTKDTGSLKTFKQGLRR